MSEPDSGSGERVVVTGSRLSSSPSDSAVAVTSITDEVAPPASPVTPPPVTTSPSGAQPPRANLLTAGDHDDRLNPELYANYADRFLKRETLPAIPRVDTRQVLEFIVQDAQGRPVPFAAVTLTCADGNTLALSTTADGAAVFFPQLDRLGDSVTVSVQSDVGPSQAKGKVFLANGGGAQRHTLTVDGAAVPVQKFDLALVIDTTGSMSDELQYLKAELLAILDDINEDHPRLDIRLALIVYRDVSDEYVTRTFQFTSDAKALQLDLLEQFAGGGGDYPEAVEQAMARAMALDWRKDAVRSLLLVADAPPHADDLASTWQSAEVARVKRIQIVPVGASGVADGAEYLMRAAAVLTQSRYIFLTDDSGIGNKHAAPAIDCYDVTLLGPLIRRTLDSQISGRRIGPRDGEVIRKVGNHDNGRCIIPHAAQ